MYVFSTNVLQPTDASVGYVNMSPPKHDLVVQDCDEALKLDPNYIKALNRRAVALENLKRYEEALRGECIYILFDLILTVNRFYRCHDS